MRRLSQILPEGIPEGASLFYANVPGRAFRKAQDRVAAMVHEVLPADAGAVVDAGCGPGWLGVGIARRRPRLRVYAVDVSAPMIRHARRNGRDCPNLVFLEENLAALSLPDGSIDMVVASETMHHWRDPVRVLDEFHRVLKPGGRVWVFDGRDDFEAEDARAWLIPTRPIPVLGFDPLLAIERFMLHVHGFTAEEWEQRVPDFARRSAFGAGTIETVGIYRRLELCKG